MQRPSRLLGAAGASIFPTQYVAVREIGLTLFSTELVLLGAALLTLAGPSVAYGLAHRLENRTIAVWAWLAGPPPLDQGELTAVLTLARAELAEAFRAR